MATLHLLHSPNLTRAELRAYLVTPLPLRHRHSLIEQAKHNPFLIKYLSSVSPLDRHLCGEILRTVENVIRVPGVDALPTPPVTPIRSLAQNQQRAPQTVTTHLSPRWKPLNVFIVRLIKDSKVRAPTLCYTLIVLDRLKAKLPDVAQGMRCTRHRIFLAALIVASKYLNDSTPKNKHWAHYADGLFETCEITLMEKQMLGLIDFDLRVTEQDIIERLAPLICPKPVVSPSTLAVPAMPITPITPITPSNAVGPRHVTDAPVLPPRRATEVKTREFVLQPVPAFKKRVEKMSSKEKNTKVESEGMSLCSSQSDPSDLSTRKAIRPLPLVEVEAPVEDRLALPVIYVHRRASASIPLCRSLSSDGLLEGSGSSSLLSARTLSSTVSSSMTSSSSISASTSTSNSEVATPADDSSHYFDQAFKSHDVHSRQLEADIATSASAQIFPKDTNGGSRLMGKLLGVGRSLSPARRVGHGVKAERKVSTATIVPDRVQIEH
ncbi:hypothetical protein FRC19_009251 [Serendipita sp. 401]|nr:hypothetical protein FRC19_009251 [Serendipita sp. 401]KAG9058471.1 hypothetical protein FS842_009539 [Serendipita sp. 407]